MKMHIAMERAKKLSKTRCKDMYVMEMSEDNSVEYFIAIDSEVETVFFDCVLFDMIEYKEED